MRMDLVGAAGHRDDADQPILRIEYRRCGAGVGVAAPAIMLISVDLNRYLALQRQAQNAGSHIFLGPAVARTAVAGGKLIQYRLVTDFVQDIPVLISNVNGKPGTGHKLI